MTCLRLNLLVESGKARLSLEVLVDLCLQALVVDHLEHKLLPDVRDSTHHGGVARYGSTVDDRAAFQLSSGGMLAE